MNPKFDWNDSIQNFVKTKVQKPELLADLVRRQTECREKRNYEKKIAERRQLYEQYSIAFRSQQQSFQLKTSFKRQLQKEIAKLAVDISKLLKQLVKQEAQSQAFRVKSETVASESLSPAPKKKNMEKQLSNQSLIFEYALIKQNLSREIKDLSDRRRDLSQQASGVSSKQQSLKKELNKQQQIQLAERQVLKIEQQLQRQRQLKRKFRYRLESAEQAKRKAQRNHYQKDVLLEKCVKRIKLFNKQGRKIMEVADNTTNQKYQQFIKKYSLHSQHAQFLNQQFQEINRGKKKNSILQSINSQIFKFQEPLVQLNKYINRKCTPQEFQALAEKCEDIELQIIRRQSLDMQLKDQIQSLKAHLQRKTKELQMEYYQFSKNK